MFFSFFSFCFVYEDLTLMRTHYLHLLDELLCVTRELLAYGVFNFQHHRCSRPTLFQMCYLREIRRHMFTKCLKQMGNSVLHTAFFFSPLNLVLFCLQMVSGRFQLGNWSCFHLNRDLQLICEKDQYNHILWCVMHAPTCNRCGGMCIIEMSIILLPEFQKSSLHITYMHQRHFHCLPCHHNLFFFAVKTPFFFLC